MLQFTVELKEEASPAMSKLRHDREVATECNKRMHVQKIDQQIDKLKEVEKLEKKEQVAAKNRDYSRADHLKKQLEHARSEYDAEYKSADPTVDDTIN